MIEIVSLILNLLLGSGLILFYSQHKRKQAAEASSAELDVRRNEFDIHRQSVEFLSRQLSEAYTEIDRMQDIINDKRLQILDMLRRTNQLEIDLLNQETIRKKLKMSTCRRADCAEREVESE